MNAFQNLNRLSCKVVFEVPNDKKLLERSMKAFEETINWVRKIAKEVKMDPVQEVCNFALDNFCLRIIEQRDLETIAIANYTPEPLTGSYAPTLPIVFYIEKVSVFKLSVGMENLNALFMRHADGEEADAGLGEFIGLRDPKSFTPLFATINLMHETRHALDSRRNSSYGSWGYAKREPAAVAVEGLIMYHYGKRDLIRLAKKHKEKIEKKTGASADDCPSEIINGYMHRYDKNLDRIFGKAASPREEGLRMSRLLQCFSCNSQILAVLS